ncbi:MAG TPA: aspartate aminotransferase family protein [Solirubrobacteraceae bacterium]|nr:aspartate aminotransferase family protein [Solirubrobacteraceae bacterium]
MSIVNGDSPQDTRFWHPFADMHAVRGHEVVIDRAEGIWIYDSDGRRFLDGTASLWYANVGHGRAEIADRVRDQMSKLEAYSTFGDWSNGPAAELATRLAEHAPMPDARVFFTTGGGESIDTAAKLARQYWSVEGRPDKVHMITRSAAYHGTNAFGTSLGGIEPNRVGFGPLVLDTSNVPYDSVAGLEQEILRIGADRVAAFFAEPVIGAGGVYPAPDGYLEGVAALCEEYNVLFIADSVICGFGRLGTWFGVERWSLQPDMIVFAKGVTSGYLPLGGVVASARVAEPFWSQPGHVFRHGATYAGHAACCAAGLANLDILENENLIPRGAELEGVLFDALSRLRDHELVTEIRGGTGLMGAVGLDLEAGPGIVAEVFAAVREGGVLTRPLSAGLAMSPPLTISPGEIERMATTIGEALDAVLSARGTTH